MRRRPSVIIVGGGFGGLSAAQALKSAPVDVTLIDRNNYHLFQPLLYQVATGSLSAGEIAAPLRSVLSHQKNTRVLRIGRLDPIHSEGTDRVDASQIHCVERLGNRERSCYAHSISFHAVKIGMEWEHSSFRRAQFKAIFNSQRTADHRRVQR